MDRNFLIRDKLKGWITQLEHEITTAASSRHVSHIYSFGRLSEQ